MRVRRVDGVLTESLCTDLSQTDVLVDEGLEDGFDFRESRRVLLLSSLDGTEVLLVTVVLDKEVGDGADGSEADDG